MEDKKIEEMQGVKDQEIIQQRSKKKKIVGVADIVLLIDATGSMTPCLDGLRKSIKENFADALSGVTTKDQIALDWRAKVVPYRDKDVDEEWINLDNPFVSDKEALKKQLDSLEAKGGGDAPESLLDALYLVINKTPWREKVAKFVIIFSDAPAKPELSPDVVEEGEERTVEHLVHLMTKDKTLRIEAFLPEHEIYKQLAKANNFIVHPIGKPGEEEVYRGLQNLDFKEVLNKLVASITLTSSEVLRA